jgi:Fe-S cluster assembly iron-binding protein IscA
MLVLTDSAKDAVRQMVDAQDGPDEAGVRIAAAPSEGPEASLGLDIAPAPEEGDTVLEEDGARVFMDEAATALLADKVLDATEHDDHVHLTVYDQNETLGQNGSTPGV